MEQVAKHLKVYTGRLSLGFVLYDLIDIGEKNSWDNHLLSTSFINKQRQNLKNKKFLVKV